MKFTNYDPATKRVLVSMTGEYDGPGYLVDLGQGRVKRLDQIDEARKFDVAGGFVPVKHHSEVPEDVASAAYQLVDAEEMKARQ